LKIGRLEIQWKDEEYETEQIYIFWESRRRYMMISIPVPRPHVISERKRR
tara:strand:+ start:3281 stop:3430 length:150 start_codon:yes stop_codon:yes gene_type:complete